MTILIKTLLIMTLLITLINAALLITDFTFNLIIDFTYINDFTNQSKYK